MKITVDEDALLERLRPQLLTPPYVQGMRNMVNDRLMLAILLMGAAEGEALGEQGVAAIRQDEIAQLIAELPRQELEEHGHGESARMVAEEVFPECFAGGAFRYAHMLAGAAYYGKVLEQNRARLKHRGMLSRLNLYMTTSFGYEIMVQLHYGKIIAAFDECTLPPEVRDPIATLLVMTLAQEETHLEMVEQHNMLLDADRGGLSDESCAALDALAQLTNEDYEWTAEVAVREVIPTVSRYVNVDAFRTLADNGAIAG